jgi:hypothetical protein
MRFSLIFGGSTNSGNNQEETAEKEPEPELSLEERLHFDFGFDPERDQRLVARSAKKFFAKDKVFCCAVSQ